MTNKVFIRLLNSAINKNLIKVKNNAKLTNEYHILFLPVWPSIYNKHKFAFPHIEIDSVQAQSLTCLQLFVKVLSQYVRDPLKGETQLKELEACWHS